MELNLKQMPEEVRNRVIRTFETLKKKHESEEFQNQVYYIIGYYEDLFLNQIIQGSAREHFKQKFEDVCYDLIFQGYYIGLEMEDSKRVHIPDHYLSQPHGTLKEDITSFIEDVTEDSLLNTLSNEENQELESWLLAQDPSLAYLFNQIMINIAIEGVLFALYDERNRRNVFISAPESEIFNNGIIHRHDDFKFITPQHFLNCTAVKSDSEIWQLHQWPTDDESEPLGILVLQKFSSEDTRFMFEHLPSYHGIDLEQNKMIFANMIISNEIGQTVMQYMAKSLVDALKENNSITNENINLSFHIKETTLYHN